MSRNLWGSQVCRRKKNSQIDIPIATAVVKKVIKPNSLIERERDREKERAYDDGRDMQRWVRDLHKHSSGESARIRRSQLAMGGGMPASASISEGCINLDRQEQ